jgi:hypothetical protein
MNVKGLTRENVASHLQKYRLYLKRMANTQDGSAIPSLSAMEGMVSSESFPAMVNNSSGNAQLDSQGVPCHEQFHFVQQHPSTSPMPAGSSKVFSGVHMPSSSMSGMQSGHITLSSQNMIQVSASCMVGL